MVNPPLIRYCMDLKNIKQSDIAKDLGKSCPLVCQVISGKTTSEPVQKHIAEKLGISYELLWGKPRRKAA